MECACQAGACEGLGVCRRSGRSRGVCSVHRGDRGLAVLERFHKLMEGLPSVPRTGRFPHLLGADRQSAEPVGMPVGSMADLLHTPGLESQSP
jgi:hypothetical protein